MQRHVGSFLHEQVNDPGTREELLASRGFCQRHAWALVPFHDALGVAIVYRHLLQELIGDLQRFEGVRRARRKGRDPGLQLRALRPTKECPVCSTARQVEDSGLHGLLRRLDDPQVTERLSGDAGLCLPHLLRAVELSGDAETAMPLIRMCLISSRILVDRLDEFIRKHDYRFRSEGMTAEEADSWTRALEAMVGKDPLDERKIRSPLG